MALEDEIKEQQEQAEATRSEREWEKTRRELASLKKSLKDAYAEQDQLAEQLGLIEKIEETHKKPPAWMSPPKSKKDHRGIVSLLLSDLHLDEVVEPKEVEGLNAFNRKIAEQRLKRTFEKAITTSRDYLAGVKYDGFNLMLGGDIISGWIHEELRETNESTVPETVDYWLDPLGAGIGMLADEFGKVHISGVVGNHGRVRMKPHAKRRVQDNIDWLIYRMLVRDFKGDSRVTFQIPESADCLVQVYNTRILMTHGDQFRGGSGIVGPLSPILLGHFRKTRRNMAADNPFDLMCVGHFHTYWNGRGVIMNGSLKGLDEYSYQGNFDFEPPQQAMWLTTPERDISFSWPIQPMDRKKERW